MAFDDPLVRALAMRDRGMHLAAKSGGGASLSDPLIPEIEEGWGHLADLVDDPNSGSSNVSLAQLKGLLAGGMEGLGGVSADMTSPTGLAGMAIGGGIGRAMSPMKKLTQAAQVKPPTNLPKPQLPHEFTPVGAEPAVGFATGSAPTATARQVSRASKGAPLMSRLAEMAGSQAGSMDTELLVKAGLAGAGALYGVPKLVQMLKSLNKQYNPFQRYADTVGASVRPE